MRDRSTWPDTRSPRRRDYIPQLITATLLSLVCPLLIVWLLRTYRLAYQAASDYVELPPAPPVELPDPPADIIRQRELSRERRSEEARTFLAHQARDAARSRKAHAARLEQLLAHPSAAHARAEFAPARRDPSRAGRNSSPARPDSPPAEASPPPAQVISTSRLLRYLPQVIAATMLVTLGPLAAAWAIGALGLVSSTVGIVAISLGLSLAVSYFGGLFWRSRPSSGDLMFGELMLWGWLRRLRVERQLSSTVGLLVGMGENPRLTPARRQELLTQLASALEARDPYTHGHSHRVASSAVMIAERLDLPESEITRVRAAALLHDVGKINTPSKVLHKPGCLDPTEFEIIKRHPVDGAHMVAALGDEELTAMVRSHHERLDGTGYPDGLSGSEIPLGARIIAVADTFDAITSIRPYRGASAHQKALGILINEAGTQLDPEVVRAFRSYYFGRRPVMVWATLTNIPIRLISWLGDGVNAAGAASVARVMAVSAVTGAAGTTGITASMHLGPGHPGELTASLGSVLQQEARAGFGHPGGPTGSGARSTGSQGGGAARVPGATAGSAASRALSRGGAQLVQGTTQRGALAGVSGLPTQTRPTYTALPTPSAPPAVSSSPAASTRTTINNGTAQVTPTSGNQPQSVAPSASSPTEQKNPTSAPTVSSPAPTSTSPTTNPQPTPTQPTTQPGPSDGTNGSSTPSTPPPSTTPGSTGPTSQPTSTPSDGGSNPPKPGRHHRPRPSHPGKPGKPGKPGDGGSPQVPPTDKGKPGKGTGSSGTNQSQGSGKGQTGGSTTGTGKGQSGGSTTGSGKGHAGGNGNGNGNGGSKGQGSGTSTGGGQNHGTSTSTSTSTGAGAGSGTSTGSSQGQSTSKGAGGSTSLGGSGSGTGAGNGGSNNGGGNGGSHGGGKGHGRR